MKDRVALVTGAGRGIGRASALALAAEGARVALTARSENELAEVDGKIHFDGEHALPIVADLSDSNTPQRILNQVREHWGPVEILVNNAGVGSSQNPQPLADFDDDFWDLTFTVNVRAPYLLTKKALPDMLAAGWGRIINISSINAKVPALHAAAYVASKHAVAGLTKATAIEVADQGITANAVCPGVTATRMNDKRIEYDARRLGRDLEEHEAQMTPIGGRLVPEDIAPMAVYLASDEARMITGQAYNMCGGVNMA